MSAFAAITIHLSSLDLKMFDGAMPVSPVPPGPRTMPSRSYSGTVLSSSANDDSSSETSTTCPSPPPSRVAPVERREDALSGEHPGERVAERDLQPRRGLAGKAVDVAKAAHRLRDDAKPAR